MAKVVKAHLPGFYDDAERIEKLKQHAKEFSYKKHISAYMNLYRELLNT